MTAAIAISKSRLQNLIEGFALTAVFQSFPGFAAASLLLKLAGSHDLVGDPGVAIFVISASLIHAALASTLGPKFSFLRKTVYEPIFFDGRLSLSDKITDWRTQPTASLQLVTIVMMLSVLAVVFASMG